MRLLKQQANSPLNHFVVTYFEAFQNGALSDAEARRFHQHLADCQRCQDWVEEQEDLIERLRVESSPQLRLSPTATERVQRNLYNRMRRAMIVNNAKTFLGAATAVLILAIVVGFFAFQNRKFNTVDSVTATPETATALPTSNPFSIALTQQALTSTPVPTPSEIDEQLFAAVTAEDVAAVEKFLEGGANPNTVNSGGLPVLLRAIRDAWVSDNTEIIELLLIFGADANEYNGSEFAFLPQAAYSGQLEVVQLLLEAGADVNATKSFISWTGATQTQAPALLHAVDGNYIEVAELLIRYGADVNQTEMAHNASPLFVAAFSNYPELVTLLLDNGADPSLLTNWETGNTALHGAAFNGAVEAVQALLEGGADVDVQTNTGLTPLMYAISEGIHRRTEIITTLLEGGADPNVQDDNGNTALHYAARNGRSEMIALLIEYGAAIDWQNDVGNTALHEAAKRGMTGALSTLLEHGASMDIENNRGQTALGVALDDRSIEILRQAGAEE